MALVYLQFFIAAAIVIWAGSRLCKTGDQFAEALGWSHHWVGLILIAMATSLPELFTSVVGTTLVVKAPDLTFGNLIGSALLNVVILAVFDLCIGGRLMACATQRHAVYSAFLVVALLFLVLTGLVFPQHMDPLGHMSIFTLSLVPVHFLGVWLLFRMDGNTKDVKQGPTSSTVGNHVRRFILLTVITFFACLWVSYSADTIAERTFFSRSVVGSIFLAAVTSLPELTVVFTAVRKGWYSLAMGTIFGSNAFNILLFAACDFVWKGSILEGLEKTSVTLVLAALLVMVIPSARFLFRFKAPFKSVNLESVAMVLVYVIVMGYLVTH